MNALDLVEDVRTALADIIAEELKAGANDLPERASERFLDWLTTAWAGQIVYIPMDLERRNARLYEAFDGKNHSELIRRFNMCASTVYKVIQREREKRASVRGKNQPDLFEGIEGRAHGENDV